MKNPFASASTSTSSIHLPSASSSSTNSLAKLRSAPAGFPPLRHPSDSLTTSSIPAGHHHNARDHYLRSGESHPGPVISKSSFVPSSLAEHLMRNKRDSALATKYLPGHTITNMEGALHTFVTPLLPIEIVGDYAFRSRHSMRIFPSSADGKQQVRRCVLSATIHPDFEDYDVGHALYGLGKQGVEGIAEVPLDFSIPSPELKGTDQTRQAYNETLR
ncbi:hypothetical protein BCR35DRAFT_123699 [Leucosporidium creatinivorum]|uniref:Uncharacterized protein n=1 Tax=Leucosporidium creatinivorum TaxID=106004 RepID=A0A1Y2EWF1_9BASI|nr:hypothetical protein BCR35DRAFT_123699 [Leucosporidium creatinivorum]